MKALRFFMAALLIAVCFSACAAEQSGYTSVLYDEDYSCELYVDEGYNGEVYAGESYADQVDDDTPPYPHVLDTTGMYIGANRGHWRLSPRNIGVGEIVIITSDGITSEARALLFTPDMGILLDYYSPRIRNQVARGFMYRVYAFGNDNILFKYWYTGFGCPDRYSYAIHNLTTGETTILVLRRFLRFPPVILENGLLAFVNPVSQVRLYDMQTGLPAAVQLDFDYGQHRGPHRAGYERFAFGLVFDTDSRQYLMLYSQGFDMRDDEGNFIESQGRLAVFNEAGRQTGSFEIENLKTWRGVNQGVLHPQRDMLIHEGRIYYEDHELDVAARFYHAYDWDRQLSQDDRRQLRQGPPLSFTIIYTPENIYIYSEGGALLQTLDGGFRLSFYKFNEDGDAVMLFYQSNQPERGSQA